MTSYKTEREKLVRDRATKSAVFAAFAYLESLDPVDAVNAAEVIARLLNLRAVEALGDAAAQVAGVVPLLFTCMGEDDRMDPHKPNPGRLVPAGAECVECAGFIPSGGAPTTKTDDGLNDAGRHYMGRA